MDRYPTHRRRTLRLTRRQHRSENVRFTQLRDLIMALPEFDDNPARCGERILEAVQQAWIDEAE